MSHMEKDLKGHQIQHRLFTDETAEAWADIYSESSNVFGLLSLQRWLRCDPCSHPVH